MTRILLLLAGVFVLMACAPEQNLGRWSDNFGEERSAYIPLDVRPFIIKRQGCDHFRGEPGYDEERKKFLIARIKELCTGTDAELKRLRIKYADQPETIKALADFEDCIEYETQCPATKAE